MARNPNTHSQPLLGPHHHHHQGFTCLLPMGPQFCPSSHQEPSCRALVGEPAPVSFVHLHPGCPAWCCQNNAAVSCGFGWVPRVLKVQQVLPALAGPYRSAGSQDLGDMAEASTTARHPQ